MCALSLKFPGTYSGIRQLKHTVSFIQCIKQFLLWGFSVINSYEIVWNIFPQKSIICLKGTISLELIISTDMFLWLPTLSLKCWFALISSSMNESNTIKCKRILSYIIQILLIRNCMHESNIIKCKSILSYISQLLLVSNSMNKNNIRCKSPPVTSLCFPS